MQFCSLALLCFSHFLLASPQAAHCGVLWSWASNTSTNQCGVGRVPVSCSLTPGGCFPAQSAIPRVLTTGGSWKGSVTNFSSLPSGAVDFSQKSSAWRSPLPCVSVRTVTTACSTREGWKTDLGTAGTEGADATVAWGAPWVLPWLWGHGSRLRLPTSSGWVCEMSSSKGSWITGSRPVTGRHYAVNSTRFFGKQGGSQECLRARATCSVAVSKSKRRAPSCLLHLIFIELLILIWKKSTKTFKSKASRKRL